jgi:hypothetical protein
MKDELFYLILTSDAFGSETIRSFPGLYSYVTSIKQNASREHIDKCKDKVWEFYESNSEFKLMFLKHYSELKNPRVDGKVFELNDRDEYTRLIVKSKTENWRYTGVSVCETHNKIRVYFY